jgi:hypothetical protein
VHVKKGVVTQRAWVSVLAFTSSFAEIDLQRTGRREQDGNESADSMAMDEDVYGSDSETATTANKRRPAVGRSTEGSSNKAKGKGHRKRAAVRLTLDCCSLDRRTDVRIERFR